MANNCNGGLVATLNVNNTDCACISIASITWNPAGTQFTITLSNGQSITSPVLTGATGAAPTISFRVSGTTLQYSINSGTSWVSIYDLSALTAKSLIHSDPDNHLTTTNGSFEVLSTFSTDHTNSAKNLVAVGDTIKLYSLFSMINSPTATGILTKLNLNGVGISNIPINAMSVINAADAQIELFTDITLKDATAGANIIRINSMIKVWDGSGFFTINRQAKLAIADVGGATVDFSANDYAFSAQAQSIATGDIELQLYTAEKLGKI